MKNILRAFVIVFLSLLFHVSKAQTEAADNKPAQTITFRQMPNGNGVSDVFEGRPPCAGIAGQLKIAVSQDCVKLKCRLSLFRDSVTLQSSRYTFLVIGGGEIITQDGNSYREKNLEGKWSIVKGIPSNPDAEVYRLELAEQATYLYLLKGDDNVLFILDEKKKFRVGNEDFSYTLNKVELVPGTK